MNNINFTTKLYTIFLVILPILVFLGTTDRAYAQDEQKKDDVTDIEDISLQDLLNVEMVSASKKSENLFDSPLSASVITRQEIERSGATSIMEALRLIPGVIVREQTPGNYDIHIRGFDNVPPNSYIPASTNTLSLVMIDNRIVYNYINGGIFWESLPIDLHDIERIEVIRGPASALYGPNAATGVINIITRRPEKNGFYSIANIQGGSNKSSIVNGAVGYKNNKFSTLFSTNYTQRDRMQDTYFDYTTHSYVDSSELHSDVGQLMEDSDYVYGDSSRSLKKYGINGFLDFNISESVHLGISGGYQDSTARKAFLQNSISPLLLHETKTGYIDLNMNISNLQAKISYLNGTQEFPGINRFDSDLKQLHVNVEYDWVGKNISIRPGVSYSNITYSGEYVAGEETLETTAISLRAEYNPFSKLRIIGAVRGDKYAHKDKPIYSFQFASTYKLNKKSLLRAVYSRAHRSPFMVDTYNYAFGIFWGNPDLDPVYINNFELGYRIMLSNKLQFDIEAAYSKSQNYSAITQVNQVYGFYNIPLKAYQGILTFTLNYSPSSQFNIKFFSSIQRTELKDFMPDVYDFSVTEDLQHTNTPDLFGGMILNYKPIKKLNINTNLYYYTSQVYELEDFTYFDHRTDISGKMLFNLKVSYNIAKRVSIFLNARNLFNNDAIEFGFSDNIKSTFLAGMSIGVN
jgi:iron complex outermembrane recepter protein